MYKLKQYFPQYHFELKSTSNESSLNDIINEIADVSFVCQKNDDERLHFEPLGEEKIVLVCAPEENIAEDISLEELMDHDLVLLSDAYNLKNLLLSRIIQVKEDFKLPILFEVDSIAAAKSAVFSKAGISFLPYMSIKKELYEKSLRIVNIKEIELHYTIYMVTKKSEDVHPLKELLEYMSTEGKKDFC